MFAGLLHLKGIAIDYWQLQEKEKNKQNKTKQSVLFQGGH